MSKSNLKRLYGAHTPRENGALPFRVARAASTR